MTYVEQKRREKFVIDAAAATTRTVSFNETTALDDTHLLVAFVQIGTSTVLTAPSGWTEVGAGGVNGTDQVRVYVRQGDGSTNDITITSASAVAVVGLRAYAGFSSLTPIASGGGNGVTSTSITFTGLPTTAGQGVALFCVGLGSASQFVSWTPGDPLPGNDSPPNATGWFNVEEYNNGAADTTVSWTGSRSNTRYVIAAMPLVVVAAPEGITGTASSVLAPLTQSASGTVASGGYTPSPIPTQEEMPANPWTDLYPAPAYTWSAAAAPSGAGFTTLNYDDSRLRLIGHAGKGTIAGSQPGYVNPAPLVDVAGAGSGSEPFVFPFYAVRVRTDASEVYFKLAQRSYSGMSVVSSRASIQVKVNGKLTSLRPSYVGSTVGFPSNPDPITAGTYYLKMTFPSNVQRDIELWTHLEFAGVVVPSTSTVGTAPAPKYRLAVLGDSLSGAEKHQTGNFALTGGAAGTYTAGSSHLFYLAHALGYDDIINSATGSSGFGVSGDTVSYKATNKIPLDITAHQPNTIIVGTSNNDIGAGRSSSVVTTDSQIVYNALRAANPNALIIALGGPTPPVMGSQATAESIVAPYNAGHKTQAQAYGLWFVNPATGQTYDPSGANRLTTGNWVYQNPGNTSSDNQHPTQDGAVEFAKTFAAAVRMAHPVAAEEVTTNTGTVTSTLPPLTQAAAGTVESAANPESGVGYFYDTPTQTWRVPTTTRMVYQGGAWVATPAPIPVPVAPSVGLPTRVASYGPNGTHWPSRTPWVGEAWDSDVEVACTWLAISTAIQTAATNFPNGKCRIRVQPGTLPGSGAGSTASPVLADIGDLGRAHRILVVPRDGAFTVSHSASWRIHNVKGVSFVGFSGWGLGVADSASTGGVLTNCQDLAWAWSKIRFVNIISQAAGESADIDLVEVVAPDQALRDEDRMAFRNDSASVTRRVLMDGCYLAPNYKLAGSSAHCDTLQMSGNSEVFEDVTLRDTAVFASTNAAVITTTPTGLDLVHSAVIGGSSAPVRYPAPEEANQFTSGMPITINGSPTATAVDSILTGKVVPVMTSVSNTRVSAEQSSVPLSGSYTVVSGLMDSTAKIDAEIPYPNDTLLQAAWTAI